MSYPSNPPPPGMYGQPPVPPAQPLYQTHVHPGSPAARSLDGVTQAWAISSLVLGILCAVVYMILSAALAVLPSTTSAGALPLIVSVCGFVSATGVVVGSIGLLARQDWGRKLLATAICGAIVTILLDLLVMAITTSPHPQFTQQMAQVPQPFPGHFGGPPAPPFVGHFEQIGGPRPMAFGGPAGQAAFQQGFRFGAVLGDIGKLVYCGLLLAHLLSSRAKNSLRALV